MARTKDMLNAQALRRKGMSLQEISDRVGASKGTLSAWCRDIALTENQIQRLVRNKQSGLRLGQLRAAENRRQRRKLLEEQEMRNGLERYSRLSESEVFAAGIGAFLPEAANPQT